jgi:cell division protein FtsB
LIPESGKSTIRKEMTAFLFSYKTKRITKMADSEPGIGKKILSFFIKENTEPTRATPVAAAPATQPKPEPSQPTPPATVQNAAGTAEVDRKFVQHFVDLLEKGNLPGPDYFEYKQALRSMEGLGLGEEKQFQAAWASFKAMGGVTNSTILKSSADQYLSILGKDRESFLKDVERATKERVGALHDELKNLEDNNKTYVQEIANLQKKIDDNKVRSGQISGEIAGQSAKINANRDSFEITYQSFVEQINSDLSKINQYLK